jgi:hypothetical protein
LPPLLLLLLLWVLLLVRLQVVPWSLFQTLLLASMLVPLPALHHLSKRASHPLLPSWAAAAAAAVRH